MSRRRTRCITWGETRRSGETLRDADGKWLGHVSFATYVTLCGRPEDDDKQPHDAVAFDYGKPRPPGVCRACWRVFVAEWRKADSYIVSMAEN